MNKHLLILICVAASVHIIYSTLWYVMGRPQYSLGGDASSYITTAQNFLSQDIWSSDQKLYPLPDNFRTPLYPLFLSFFLFFHLSFFYAVVFQDSIMILGVAVVYVLGKKLFSERIAFFASLILALSPYLASSFVSRSIMAEPFSFLFTSLSFLLFALYIRDTKQNYLYLGSLFLALDALTKPQFVLFSFFILLAFIYTQGKKKVSHCVISLGLFGLLISPWLYYTFTRFRVLQFSSVSHTTLFDASVRFQSWREGTRGKDYRVEGRKVLDVENDPTFTDTQLFEPHNALRLASYGISYISHAPFSYIVYHLIHIPRLFYHDTTIDSLYEDFGIFSSIHQGDDIQVIKDGIRGNISSAWYGLIDHPAWILSLSLKFLTLLMSILAFSTVFFERKRHMLFLVGVIAVYGALVSPFGLHRYRVPIEPLLLLLAFNTISIIKKRSTVKYPVY